MGVFRAVVEPLHGQNKLATPPLYMRPSIAMRSYWRGDRLPRQALIPVIARYLRWLAEKD